MNKTIKGFVNKTKKGTLSVTTSVFNGRDADKDIQENIIASLEKFGFKKGKSNNENWLQFNVYINDNSKDEMERVEEVIAAKSRVSVNLNKRAGEKDDLISIVSVVDSNDEVVYVMENEEKEKTLFGYINILDNGAMAISSSVAVNDEEVESKVRELTSMGFNEGASKNDDWRGFTWWNNKPTDYEKELVSESDKYKYTLKINSYRDGVSSIDSLISVEPIEGAPSTEEKTEAEDEADF